MNLFSPSTIRLFSQAKALFSKKLVKRVLWLLAALGLIWFGWMGVSRKFEKFFDSHRDARIYVELPWKCYVEVIPKPKSMYTYFFSKDEFLLETSWGWIGLGKNNPLPNATPSVPELVWQTRLGESENVQKLLASGVDVNAADTNGVTALMWAARRGNSRILDEIMLKKPNVNQKTQDGLTAMMIVTKAIWDPRPGDRSYWYRWRDENGHYFVEAPPISPIPMLESLLKAGADINGRDASGMTPLMMAAQNGSVDSTKFLIQHGADVNALDNGNFPVLQYALFSTQYRLNYRPNFEPTQINPAISILKTAGATNVVNLFLAAWDRDLVTAKALIHDGVDVDTRGPEGITALMIAAGLDDEEMAKLLLENGADPRISDHRGDTASILVPAHQGWGAITGVAKLLRDKIAFASLQNGDRIEVEYTSKGDFHDVHCVLGFTGSPRRVSIKKDLILGRAVELLEMDLKKEDITKLDNLLLHYRKGRSYNGGFIGETYVKITNFRGDKEISVEEFEGEPSSKKNKNLLTFRDLINRALEKSDPIERLAARLSADSFWQNGSFPELALPENASTEQVVSRVFEMTGFDKGHVTDHRILEARQVHISGSLYTAVLVETNFGKKIVLLNYRSGWWSRVYDAR